MDTLNIKNYLKELKEIMQHNKDYLIELDSVVGDGDLGLTMQDGFAAAYSAVAVNEEMDIGKLLYTAGKAMGNAVPSTMGTLMASGFMNSGKALRGKTEMSKDDCASMFRGYMEGVASLGKAKVGEKTFLDGIAPAVDVLEEAIQANDDLKVIAEKAMLASKRGVENTTTMRAMHGRAAIRGDASIALIDPGATVAALMFEAFYNSL